MSDLIKPPEEVKHEVYRLIVTLDRTTKDVSVDAPIHDRVICLGMLSIAAQCLHDYYMKQESSTKMIVGVRGPLPPFKT